MRRMGVFVEFLCLCDRWRTTRGGRLKQSELVMPIMSDLVDVISFQGDLGVYISWGCHADVGEVCSRIVGHCVV